MLNLSSSGSRGRAGHRRARGAWLSAVAVAGLLALGVPTASVAAVRAGSSQPATAQAATAQASAAQASAARTTRQYVIRFWPRYISYVTQNTLIRLQGFNTLLGPTTINPQFHAVVAINDDTRYAFGMVNLSHGPVVLTIPPTNVVYSLLVIDFFGNVIPVSIKPPAPGTYALVPSGWKGKLPPGLKKVTVPYLATIWNIRADRFSSAGQDMTAQADAFRRALRMTTLAQWEADHASGAAKILPVVPTFFPSIKLLMDTAVTLTPNVFLRVMQRAVADPLTQPLYPSDIQLSHAFDQVFAAARQAAARGNPVPLARIDAAARGAYAAIVAAWLTGTGPTNWIHQDNFGEWGTHYLARAAGNEYIYGGNNNAAASYWDAFTDGTGLAAERRPAQLHADLLRQRTPAGQAVLVAHRLPPGPHRADTQPAGQVPGRQLHAGLGHQPGRLGHHLHGGHQTRRRAHRELAAGASRAVQCPAAGLRPHRQHRPNR